MATEYLSKDEQYARLISMEQISRIKDVELRDIRRKYWNLWHNAFIDERRIPDAQLGGEMDRIKNMEMEEIKRYRDRKGDW